MHTHRSFCRTLPGLLTALLLVAAATACHKPAKPSEDYFQASKAFGKLYAEKGDEAFLDPRLSSIEAQLAKVPTDSLDVAAANELQSRIRTGKQQALAQQKAKADALASARQQSALPSGSFSFPTPTPPPKPTEPREDADAGTRDAGAVEGPPGIGTPVARLASGFNGCFQQGESLNVQGHGMRERWDLADRPDCRRLYGSLQGQLLIIEEGKVLGTAPLSSIQRVSPDSGTPASPP